MVASSTPCRLHSRAVDYFRRVISDSSTLVDQQDDDAPEEATYPLGAWEYHSGLELIAREPGKPGQRSAC